MKPKNTSIEGEWFILVRNLFVSMGLHGHTYDAPSSSNPGLLMFLVDKGMYNQHSNLMPTLRSQIVEICKRFADADKKKLFRLVVCEFANAPQQRKHKSRVVDPNDIVYIFGKPSTPWERTVVIEGANGGYKFDRMVEDFTNSDGIRLFEDFTTVKGSNIKAAIKQAESEVVHHLNEVCENGDSVKPPISILLFTRNTHSPSADYSTNATKEMGSHRNENYFGKSVDQFASNLLINENVLFGVFNLEDKAGSLTLASHFDDNMLEKALSAEARYEIPADERLGALFNDPKGELVGKPFIFTGSDIRSRPKFLAAMIRLGTSTILENMLQEEDPTDGDDGEGDWGR